LAESIASGGFASRCVERFSPFDRGGFWKGGSAAGCAERLCLSDLVSNFSVAAARLSLAAARKDKGSQPGKPEAFRTSGGKPQRD